MLIFGVILILVAIWSTIVSNIFLLKPLGFMIGIVGAYIILRHKKNGNLSWVLEDTR